MPKISKLHGKTQFLLAYILEKSVTNFHAWKNAQNCMENPSFLLEFILGKCIVIFHLNAWRNCQNSWKNPVFHWYYPWQMCHNFSFSCLFSELDSHNKSLWLWKQDCKDFQSKKLPNCDDYNTTAYSVDSIKRTVRLTFQAIFFLNTQYV